MEDKAGNRSSPPPKDANEFLSDILREIQEWLQFDLYHKSPICVFSLSEDGDLLSQWRGYCPPKGGYSIRFSASSLANALIKGGFHLGPCTYDESEQEFLVRKKVEKFRVDIEKKWSERPPNFPFSVADSVVDFYIDFSRLASSLKHPSFHQECEWRIITPLIPNKNMSFRVKKFILLPYYRISIKGIDPFPIEEIIVGPSPEQGLAESALKQFLLKKELKIWAKSSKTPFREL